MNEESLKELEKSTAADKPQKVKWAAFIESDIVNLFNLHELEKMSMEDGNGNKAKLTRQKDNGIKVEYSSVTLL